MLPTARGNERRARAIISVECYTRGKTYIVIRNIFTPYRSVLIPNTRAWMMSYFPEFVRTCRLLWRAIIGVYARRLLSLILSNGACGRIERSLTRRTVHIYTSIPLLSFSRHRFSQSKNAYWFSPVPNGAKVGRLSPGLSRIAVSIEDCGKLR